MHLRKLWLLAGVVLTALAIVTTGSASQQSAKASGTVIFGADQEPGILNGDIIGGNLFWGAEVISPVFPTSYRVYPDFSFRPELAKATVQTNPFRLTYHINKKAVWYEAGGKTVPITAQDYVTGWRIIMNKDFKILSQVGYEDIKSFKIINKKTVRFTFSKPFAGWKTLFSSQTVLPTAAMKSADVIGCVAPPASYHTAFLLMWYVRRNGFVCTVADASSGRKLKSGKTRYVLGNTGETTSAPQKRLPPMMSPFRIPGS